MREFIQMFVNGVSAFWSNPWVLVISFLAMLGTCIMLSVRLISREQYIDSLVKSGDDHE